jgi:hypothetical protein
VTAHLARFRPACISPQLQPNTGVRPEKGLSTAAIAAKSGPVRATP